jgi:hypothetical protein
MPEGIGRTTARKLKLCDCLSKPSTSSLIRLSKSRVEGGKTWSAMSSSLLMWIVSVTCPALAFVLSDTNPPERLFGAKVSSDVSVRDPSAQLCNSTLFRPDRAKFVSRRRRLSAVVEARSRSRRQSVQARTRRA